MKLAEALSMAATVAAAVALSPVTAQQPVAYSDALAIGFTPAK